MLPDNHKNDATGCHSLNIIKCFKTLDPSGFVSPSFGGFTQYEFIKEFPPTDF